MTTVPIIDGATGEQIGTVDAPDPTPLDPPATVDVDAFSEAVARTEAATTIAGLRAAVLALAAAINPEEQP